VRSHTGNLLFHLLLRALPQAHHGDHGADADDDAQHRQQRTRFISRERIDCDFPYLPRHESISVSAIAAQSSSDGIDATSSLALRRARTASSLTISPS